MTGCQLASPPSSRHSPPLPLPTHYLAHVSGSWSPFFSVQGVGYFLETM